MTAPGGAATAAPPVLVGPLPGPRRTLQPPMAALFLLPALVFLGAFVVWPAVATIARSLYDQAGNEFVGFDNYRTMFELRRMRRAITNSFVWVVVFPTFVVTIGLVLAVLSDRLPWKTAFKTLLFLPMAISLLASGVIWRIVYERDPDRGVINAALDLPQSILSPSGSLAGAVAATPDIAAERDGALRAPVREGVALVGLLRLAEDDLPEGARPARPPEPSGDGITGAVWRDVRPGKDIKGEIEPGELGIPGVRVELIDASGRRLASDTTDEQGTFRFDDVDASGERFVRVAGSNFREEWPGVAWLGPSLVTPAAILAAVWVWAGFAMVTIGAGLAAVDRQLLEAARVDGASEWQVFRRVTVPLLAPVLGVVFITMTINALKMFDLVYAVAPGSVQDDANVIALEMWRTAFTGAGNRGLGAAIAVFLFVLVLPVMAFNIRRFRVEEDRR